MATFASAVEVKRAKVPPTARPAKAQADNKEVANNFLFMKNPSFE
jgi:hypothetical protein